ncbi:MAG: hypothetical protein Ct9H300mP1_11780 [Planctomycetaceae bacterium]|nr:MAG: hypothetical protein Ct9H300mP1_11780 [Planctomycetaceae bacterium]
MGPVLVRLTYLLAFETLAAIGSVGFLSMAMRISGHSGATVFPVYMTLSNVSHVVGNWLAGPVRRITTGMPSRVDWLGPKRN